MMTEISLLKYRDKDSDKYFADLSGLFGKSNSKDHQYVVWDKKNFLLFGLTKVQPFQVTGRAQKITIIGNVFYGWILEDFLKFS